MQETDRKRIVAWVASSVMPHEPFVRAWLRQRLQSREDIDDLIQEAYAKLSALTSIDHITRPETFFFQIVRNLLIDQIRHARVVRIEAATEIDFSSVYTDEPTPERITAARRELAKVAALIEALPERCRQVFTMRKIEGVSQREIARRLGVSESVVENEGVKGLKLILQGLKDGNGDAGRHGKVRNERSAKRKRD